MHETDNQQNRVFFDWKVFGREEEEVKCVWRREEWGGVKRGRKKEEVDGEVGEDKTCLRESYITVKFSPEPCIEINRRINDQISL